jgi:arylsulfatase A-like enzyme
MAGFKASAWKLDQGIGTVLNALNDSGLSETTLVVCTTDHGIAFPQMKGSLTDHGIGVLLIMRGPDGFSGGKVYDTLVSQIDLFPTICDLLCIDYPDWLQGASLLPLVRDETKRVHDAIFAEVTYHAAYEPQRAVRTPRWKYIRRFDQYAGLVLPNCDDSSSKEFLLQHNWREQTRPMEELHDLIFDPNEARNIAYAPSSAVILKEMRRRLDGWMLCTNDPLLHGSVTAPSGSELNDPDQVSPSEPTHIV